MTPIEVPSETLVVEIGKDGLNIVETFMQMSGMYDSAQAQCDICSKPLGKMKDVKHIMSPESITIAVRNGFKPEKMLKATENMLKEEGEENPAEIMEIVLDSWKSIVDKSETPWVLCDEFYKSIQIYIKKDCINQKKLSFIFGHNKIFCYSMFWRFSLYFLKFFRIDWWKVFV